MTTGTDGGIQVIHVLSTAVCVSVRSEEKGLLLPVHIAYSKVHKTTDDWH